MLINQFLTHISNPHKITTNPNNDIKHKYVRILIHKYIQIIKDKYGDRPGIIFNHK